MEAHLVTVGTSVLRNALQALGEGHPCTSVLEGGAGRCRDALGYCVDPRRLDDHLCGLELSRGSACWRFVECVVASDPYRASAELNAMRWVLEGRRGEVRAVVLYHTDTSAGRISAEVLRDYLSSACPQASVEVKCVPGLAKRMWEGLANLARMVAEDVARLRREGLLVYVNLTGGFKPESAAALLAAAVAGASAAYYVHEAMREPVWIPIPPLALDVGRLRSLLDKVRLLAERPFDPRDPALADAAWAVHVLDAMGYLVDAGGGLKKLRPEVRRMVDFILGYLEGLSRAV